MCDKIKTDTSGEKTANDSFLIEGKNSGSLLKISYKSNLKEKLKDFDGGILSDIGFSKISKREDLRKLATELEKKNYFIYQLTRL